MIDSTLREFIEPNLKLHLKKEEWQYIDEMFSEVYYTNVNGVPLVTLKPTSFTNDIALQFRMVNGTFFEITNWSYIKTIGKLL